MSLDDLTQEPSNYQPAKKSRAWLLPVCLILGFILIIGLFFGDRLIPAKEVEASPVVTIRSVNGGNTTIKKAHSESKELLFQASGWVEPDPYTTYVTTLVSGVVVEVLALEGATVKKGDLLAKLVSEDAQLDVDAAARKYTSMEKRMASHITGLKVNQAEIVAVEQRLEAIKSRVTDAKDYFARVVNLKSGSISQQTITQAKLAVIQQQALFAEAEAEIPKFRAKNQQIEAEHEAMHAELNELATMKDRAELSLQRTNIVSPMDGVVLKLHASPGRKRMLASDNLDSAVIVELYNPLKLQARIDVPLNEAAAIRVGQHVEMVTDILADQIFTGKVTRISGQADLQRNTLQVKVEIDKPDAKLRPDMLMRAKFYGGGYQSKYSISGSDSSSRLVIYVDERALVDDESVWVVSPKFTAELRKIKLSSVSKDGFRLVIEGLLSGEDVILPPHDNLKEGTRVQPNQFN